MCGQRPDATAEHSNSIRTGPKLNGISGDFGKSLEACGVSEANSRTHRTHHYSMSVTVPEP